MKTGLWAIDGDTLVRVAGWDVGPAIVAVPSEAAPVIVVDVPAARAGRQEALASAVAQRIAVTPDAVHVAVGPGPAANSRAVAVVDHDVMRRWLAAIGSAGLDHALVVPDAMLLPLPPTGSWTVALSAGRVRVRTDDGGGFAVSEINFAAAWVQGGRLTCDVAGDAAPGDIPPDAIRHVPAPPLAKPVLDLRQGPYAPRGLGVARGRRLGLILAGGLLAHTAVAAADTVKLRALAEEQRPASTPRHADFLPLMIRASTVLGGQAGIDLAGLTFDGERLTLRVAGPPAPLRAALRSADLDTVVVEVAS